MKSSKKTIVSACLAGLHCRYDCASKTHLDIVKMVERGEAVPLCPEQLGGMPTPRPPAERQNDGRIMTIENKDVTPQYDLGAQEALLLTKILGADTAYLKNKSPMCGAGKIYDGSFRGKIISGDGVFTQLLKKLAVKIIPID